MSEKPKVDLGLLEEDDEFEEFPAEGIIIWLLYMKVDNKRVCLLME